MLLVKTVEGEKVLLNPKAIEYVRIRPYKEGHYSVYVMFYKDDYLRFELINASEIKNKEYANKILKALEKANSEYVELDVDPKNISLDVRQIRV